MILVLDNLDSFTYNLVDVLKQGPLPVSVIRNDAPLLDDRFYDSVTGLLISPGPGRPENAGNMPIIAEKLLGKVSVFGVCLGHQWLGQHVGMKLTHASEPMHGRTSPIFHDGHGVFKGVPNPFQAMRYHSLLLETCSSQDPDIVVTARGPCGEIMGVRHKFLNFESVQFHPESILTAGGALIVHNWIRSLIPDVRKSPQEKGA